MSELVTPFPGAPSNDKIDVGVDETVDDLTAADTGALITSIDIANPSNAIAYLQIFDLVKTSVTVGTTTPVKTYSIASGDCRTIAPPHPIKVEPNATNGGVSYAATTGRTTNGAPSAALSVHFYYR